ncbi:hypothetical protein, partial [Halomonas sp.]|uniref:hypothetical protein n=1 Tax=Halomonas sp. TaxID=1486246 RepID=UPI003F90E170
KMVNREQFLETFLNTHLSPRKCNIMPSKVRDVYLKKFQEIVPYSPSLALQEFSNNGNKSHLENIEIPISRKLKYFGIYDLDCQKPNLAIENFNKIIEKTKTLLLQLKSLNC